MGALVSDHDHPSAESTQKKLTRPWSTRCCTAATMPWSPKSSARPASLGKTSTGRPQWPWRITPRRWSVPGTWSSMRCASTASSCRMPAVAQDFCEVRVQRVAPGGVVVQVRQLDMVDPVTGPREGGGHRGVVGSVLLQGTTGQPDPQRPLGASPVEDLLHPLGDPPVVGEGRDRVVPVVVPDLEEGPRLAEH